MFNKLLCIEPQFRNITVRLILETILNLEGNKIDKSNMDLLINIFKDYILSIKKDLLFSKIIKDEGTFIFKEELKNHSSIPIEAVIESILSRPFLLIPFNLEDDIEGKVI